MDAASIMSSRDSRFVLSKSSECSVLNPYSPLCTAGEPGTGKSFTLLQALQYCSSRNWIVMYIPRGENPQLLTLYLHSHWFSSGDSRQLFDTVHLWPPNSNVSPTSDSIPTSAEIPYCQPCRFIKSHNKPWSPVGQEIYSASWYTTNWTYRCRAKWPQHCAYDPEYTFVGARRADLVSSPSHYSLGLAWHALRYPVLLAIDDFNALYCKSTYRDPQFHRIKSYHLSVPRLLLEYASGKKSFVGAPTFLRTDFPLISYFFRPAERSSELFLQHKMIFLSHWNYARLSIFRTQCPTVHT